MSIVLVAVMAVAAQADSRVAVLAEPDQTAAVLVALAGRGMQVATGATPVGEVRFDRAAVAQHAALDDHAVAAVWVEQDASKTEVCVVSADGSVFRHAPLPIDDRSPRVFAAIAMSLLDELLTPPPEPISIHVDVSVDAPGALVAVRPPRSERTPKFMIDGGGFVAKRGMMFDYDPSSKSPPPDYTPSPIQGVQVSGAIYPMPLKNIPMTGIGLAFAASHSVGGVLTAHDDTGYGDYSLMHSALSAGVHYRYPIDLVTLEGLVEIGQSEWRIVDLPASIEIPDTNYKYIAAGLHLDLPVTKEATLGASARYMSIQSYGDVMDEDWYGAGSGYGYALDAGLLLRLPASLYLKALVLYQRENIEFDGSGAVTMAHGVWGLKDSTLGSAWTVGLTF